MEKQKQTELHTKRTYIYVYCFVMDNTHSIKLHSFVRVLEKSHVFHRTLSSLLTITALLDSVYDAQ